MNPVLSVSNVSKRYGAVQALNDVSLDVNAGEIHAVLGENGAGKSTLMGVLAGFVTPDSGTGTIEGSPLTLGNPVRLRKAGIAMVHQHFLLVPNFTVDENLALAQIGHLGRALNIETVTQPAYDAANRIGWNIDGKSHTGALPVGVQQRIEILKALSGQARVLILDEPTAVLAPDEVEDLMTVLRRLKSEGVAVVLIAHKLSEVVHVADRVTVLRKGRTVATSLMSATNADQLAEWMIGERVVQGDSAQSTRGQTQVRVENLVVKGDRGEVAVRGVSFEVGRGEILGVGGVDGNGQVELAESLADIRQPNGGTIVWLTGKKPSVAYIPQDRQSDGLALSMSVFENMEVAGLDDPDLTVGPFIKPSALKAWAARLVERFDVQTPSLSQPAENLSGGNQQKIIVARTLARRPDLLVAVNPTRGLDIRATVYVHDCIRGAAREGTSVLLVSTDADELSSLAHRVVYLSRGLLTDRLIGGNG